MMRLIAVVHNGYDDCYSKSELELLRKNTSRVIALDDGTNITERR